MKKSKRPKASKRKKGVDRISDLPDPILHLILSRLPTTEQVIRTSILSTRWRYLWASIPSLDISCYRRLNPQTEFDKDNFNEFVYWILVNQSLDLMSFRLNCSDYYPMSTVGRWIHAAVMRKVKALDLMFCPRNESEDVRLPHCLVTCESLVYLRLFLFRRPLCLPNFTGFPALRVLELNSVELFDEDLLEEFLKRCPLLVDLSLIDCFVDKLDFLSISCPELKRLRIDNHNMVDYEYPDDSDSEFKDLYEHQGLCKEGLYISCPKLVYFEYEGHIAYQFVFENLDSLETAVIHPEDMLQKELSFESLGDTICELFAGISHVEVLSIGHYFVQAINAARDPDGDFPASLPNLKILEITITIEAYTMNVLIRILKCSPNFETLSVIILEEYFRPELWELDEDETIILLRHLKRVEFRGFNGENPKLGTALFFLEHGNVLEEMVFCWPNKAKYHEKSTKAMKKISNIHKASSTVKLITQID